MRAFTGWIRRYLPLLLALVIVAAVVVLGARGTGPMARFEWVKRLGGRADPVVAAPEDALHAPDDTSEGGTTPTSYELSGVVFDAGDCATWDQELGTITRTSLRVACSEPHLIEVAQRFEQDPSGFDLSGPSEAQWTVIDEHTCRPMAEAYLGYPIDPHGRFVPGLIKPTVQGWSAGDRTTWCGIEVRDGTAGTVDRYLPYIGEAKGADQTLLYGAGTCFAPSPDQDFGNAVACTEPHVGEVTGTVDLTDLVTAFPSGEAYPPEVFERCRAQAESTYGGPLPDDVHGSWLLIEQTSWDAGRRQVECLLTRYSPAGDLVPVTGPLRR